MKINQVDKSPAVSVCRLLRTELTGCRSRVVVWCRTSSRVAGRWRRRRRRWPSGWLYWWPLIATSLSVSRGGSPTSPRINDELVSASWLFSSPPYSITLRDTSNARCLSFTTTATLRYAWVTPVCDFSWNTVYVSVMTECAAININIARKRRT